MGMMKTQRGLTLPSWMMVITIAGLLLLVTIKLVPIYIENWTIQSVLENLNREGEQSGKTVFEIRENLLTRFGINGVRTITKDDIAIEASGTEAVITVAYEVRTPVLGNVDLVVSFEDTQRISIK